MKLDVSEIGIQIVPENAQDIIYIQEFLKLRQANDSIDCVRHNASGLSCIAYLEIKGAKH